MTELPSGFVMCDTCGEAWFGGVECDCNTPQSRKTAQKQRDTVRPAVMVSFTVPGKPVAKQRPRTQRRRGKYVTVTPDKTKQYEATVAKVAAMATDAPFAKTVELSVHLVFYQTDDVKRDIDNMIKSVLDGMNKVVYHDDYQIVRIQARLHRKAHENKVTVMVTEISD